MGLYQPRSDLSENLLSTIPEDLRLRVITPPPSVINAYFAELYQRRVPREAMDYFLDLSRAFDLFTVQQSFDEQNLYPPQLIRVSLMAWPT